MVKKKVLVTGASGYIGSRLCQYLAEQEYSVTALCHFKIPSDIVWTAKMDEIIIGDLRNDEFINEIALKEFQIVIHLVSLDHFKSNNGSPSIVSAVNITPVWTLLDAFVKKKIEKFIYFSTMQVYGSVSEVNVKEDHLISTQSAYGLTHHIGEIICDYYNRNSSVHCSSVRLSNSYGAPIFGDNNCWWLVINDLCRMAFLEEKIVLQSDGTPLRDFIHGWDVCSAVKSVIETNLEHSVYNISSGITLSIMEIALKIKEVYFSRYTKELEIQKKESNSSFQKPYEIDNTLIQSIGFKPEWTLERGINDLFDYLEKESENIILKNA